MKKISDILEKLAQSHSRSRIITDFLTMVVCALSMQTQEELYLQTVKNYERKDLDLFCEAFALLVIEMDNGGEGLRDCLGDYFQEFISGGYNGQFFTPENICELMASLTIFEDNMQDNKTVNDCACGSGRTLLAAAKRNRNLFFSGADISRDCVFMTLINLCLNNLQGEVIWMDTLRYKIFDSWTIKKSIFGVCCIEKQKVNYIEIPEIKPLQIEKPKADSSQLLLDFVA